jgi:hypothetical protein
VIYAVAFDPIKISTCWALQNDRQNLSFVKATNVVGEKKARNTCKMANSKLCHFHFETEFILFSNRNFQNVLTTSEVRSEKQPGLASASLRKNAIEKRKRLIVEGHVILVILGRRKLRRKKHLYYVCFPFIP